MSIKIAQKFFDSTAQVQDAFDIKASYGPGQAPGVVLVLESFPMESPRSLVGHPVKVWTPEGRSRVVPVDDVRDHGKTVSLFFKGLGRADLPAGSVVEFPE